MDLGYFGKPFIYVDSDLIELPANPVFDTRHLCRLPLGPSSHWHSEPLESANPYFPSWLGWFSRGEKLAGLLMNFPEEKISHKDHQAFIDEYWYKNDGKASERIADFAVEYFENRLSSWRFFFSLPRMRGQIRDFINFVYR
jgi:hypothetical protein